MHLTMTDVNATGRKSHCCLAPAFLRDRHNGRHFPRRWSKMNIQEPLEKKASEKRTELISTHFQNTALQAIRPRYLVWVNTWKTSDNFSFNQCDWIRVCWLTQLVTFTTIIMGVKSGIEFIQSICKRTRVVGDQRLSCYFYSSSCSVLSRHP